MRYFMRHSITLMHCNMDIKKKTFNIKNEQKKKQAMCPNPFVK